MSAAARVAVTPAAAPQTAPAPGRHRPALRLVGQPQRVAPRLPFVAVVVAMLAIGLVGLLLLSMQRAQASFHQASLARADSALGDQQQALLRLVEQDGDPAVLGSRAAALGMVPESTPGYISPAGHVIGVVPAGAPTPSHGAPAVDGVVVAGVAAPVQPATPSSAAPRASASAAPTAKATAPTAGASAGTTPTAHPTRSASPSPRPRATPTGGSSR